MIEMSPFVKHCKQCQDGILIDRTTRWGNQYWKYCSNPEPTHEEKVAAYAKQIAAMIDSGIVSVQEVANLYGKTLRCWCRDDRLPIEKQKTCHGDVLAAAARQCYELLDSKSEIRSGGEVMVKTYSGYYEFLSNFYTLRGGMEWMGYRVPTSEHAYQMSKFVDHPEIVKEIARATTPGRTKYIAREHKDKVRSGWYDPETLLSVVVMEAILRVKFSDHDLMQKLINTKGIYLQEGNWWGDKFFGVCTKTGVGENHLGRLHMKIRDGEDYDRPF